MVFTVANAHIVCVLVAYKIKSKCSYKNKASDVLHS
jgi:hypothetical protein